MKLKETVETPRHFRTSGKQLSRQLNNYEEGNGEEATDVAPSL
ncbi:MULTISPECIES: hypothetical protein [unclassified Fischerella]|jgi:hypothetical protein|nr:MULTISPECIES: hypothetical protein [unclassified Fischerella]